MHSKYTKESSSFRTNYKLTTRCGNLEFLVFCWLREEKYEHGKVMMKEKEL